MDTIHSGSSSSAKEGADRAVRAPMLPGTFHLRERPAGFSRVLLSGVAACCTWLQLVAANGKKLPADFACPDGAGARTALSAPFPSSQMPGDGRAAILCRLPMPYQKLGAGSACCLLDRFGARC